MKYFSSLCLLFLLVACHEQQPDKDPDIVPAPSGIAAPASISYNIISQYPHDTSSFTEGLEFFQGKLYESGGDYENSVLQYGNHITGVIDKKNKMGSNKIFGEGITVLKNKLYQLTYTSHIVYVYDVNNILKPVKTFNWPYEGWGMTNNGTDLIIDTGGPELYFVDPETFKVKNTVAVVDHRGPVPQINELEYVDGFIWANVWESNRIVKIDPESGHVVGEMYIDKLAAPNGQYSGTEGIPERTDVLNGIAYDSSSKSFFITGKRWPKLYQLKIN